MLQLHKSRDVEIKALLGVFAAGPKDPEPAYDAVMTRGAVPAQARIDSEYNDGVADRSAVKKHD